MPIFLEAVHTVYPLTDGVFDRYVEIYGELVVPAFGRHGFDLLGAWKRTGGPMGQDVLLVRFDSLADFERASASLMSDAVIQTQLFAQLDKAGATIRESAKSANPVPYATEARLEEALSDRPAAPRQYAQAVLQLELGGQPKAYDLIGQLADRVAASGAGKLATAYETALGQRGEVTDLWILNAGVGDLSYRPGDPLGELIGPLREVAPEESTYYLNPLPYSPLQ